MIRQTTIKQPVTVSGVGLHTGAMVNLTFRPAAENHGYKFRRIDLDGQPVIDADADNVTDTSRGTTLEQNGGRISTTEHALAALVGCEIDNVLIDVDGPVDVVDGKDAKDTSTEVKSSVDSTKKKKRVGGRVGNRKTKRVGYQRRTITRAKTRRVYS